MAAADPFIGQIQAFGFNFAPRGWAFCSGALLPISQNTALFSLLGTIYGGDGRTTFQLPDLRGRSPMNEGTGPGLPNFRIGQRGGAQEVTLITSQIPSHNHVASTTTQTQVGVSNSNGGESIANGQVIANHPGAFSEEGSQGTGLAGVTSTSTTTLAQAGGSQSHNNMQPFLALNYCIALEGTYPSRA